ncbi:MAG: ADP-ribosylation factor-like protein [Candidatus Helarchaeota archaeon]
MNHKSNNNQSNRTKRKILVIGLNNSGKSSIILSLIGNSNLMSYVSLKPNKTLTIINYWEKSTNIQYNIWDLSGNNLFLQDSINKLQDYLIETNKVIYIIDIQNPEKYELSLKYLELISPFIINNNIDTLIFLHKCDPQLETNNLCNEEIINSQLISKIKNIFPFNFNYKIYKTSIFTVFRKKKIIL